MDSGIVVAVVGVAGTLTGTGVTQWFATRARRIDAEQQRRDRADEREAIARATAQAEKLSFYTDLNAGARLYRAVCQDALYDLERGVTPLDIARMERVREDFHELYARAQMIMSDPALKVASEVNVLLAEGYRMVRELDGAPEPAESAFLHGWFQGPSSNGIWLLRLALRDDLGTAEMPEEARSMLASLYAERESLVDEWARLRQSRSANASITGT